MDKENDLVIIKNFLEKYKFFKNDYSLFTDIKFLDFFNQDFSVLSEKPTNNDPVIIEFISIIQDLKEYWYADYNINNRFHPLGNWTRFLDEIKILFYNNENKYELEIIEDNSFNDLFSGYQLFAILNRILKENKKDGSFFLRYVLNGKIGYLIKQIKIWFDIYHDDFEKTTYQPWNRGDKLYNKSEIQDLMRRRVERTHRAFFERYKVESVQQLDDLFKEKELIKRSASNCFKNPVGLIKQNRILDDLVDYYQKNKKYEIKEKFLYCFCGNSGTGKSLFGRMISNKLSSAGLIHTNRFIELSAHQLAYQGCAKSFELAAGGVLYVSGMDLLEENDDNWFYREYGKKTLHDLIHEIDTYNENMIIILAGNKIKIDRILNQNKELKSRIFDKVDFPDYKTNEIVSIATDYIASYKYEIEQKAIEEIGKIDEYYKKIGDYANARTIISVVRNLFVIQSRRTCCDDDRTITIEDVKNYENDTHIVRQINESANSSHSMLNRLVGLKKVKEQVLRFRAFALKHRDDFAFNNNLHMCFTGNPGTGKTEVAKLLARILYEDGILPQDKLIMVTRADLVAEYVGQTAPKTRKCINDAMGGVLFIDEAYSLLTGYGSNYDYGAEAIAELVASMEENKGKFMVIFAGYRFETLKLIESNTGLKSRVNHFIDFENYSLNELEKIMDLKLSESKYLLSENCRSEIKVLLKKMRDDDDFGNARVIRKILEKLYEIQALRTKSKKNDNLITEADFMKLKKDDEFVKYFKDETNMKIDVKKIKKHSFEILNDVDERIKECTVLISVKENERLVGEGTGFFIQENGLIATNAHVVEKGDLFVSVNFKLTNGKYISKEYECRVIRINKNHDVALIQIIKPDINYQYIPLSLDFEYEKMVRKEFCMAGYPLGGSRFKNVTINHGFIQSYNKDAALDEKRKDLDWIFMEISGGHPGNSGSSVVCDGKCIGIFSGVAIKDDAKIRHTIPAKYLWELIENNPKGK